MLDKKSASLTRLDFLTQKSQTKTSIHTKSSHKSRRIPSSHTLNHINTPPQVFLSTRSLFSPSTVRPLTAPSLFSPQSSYNFISYKVEGISQKQLSRIYEAKCEDLNIPVIPDQMKRFFTFCEKTFRNRSLNLAESGIGPLSAEIIGEILRNNSNFGRLELAKNAISDNGIKGMIGNIMKNNSLVHLDISSNDITPDGAKPILLMLTKHTSLVSIDISSHEGLHRNRLGVQGSAPLKSLLLKNNLLNYLNLAGTFVGEGIQYIIEGLQHNSTLTSLNLARNNIPARWIENLSRTTMKSKVQDLNLGDNRFGNEGLEFISNMLSGLYEGQCPIKKLDISKNDITVKGANKFFASLRNNPNIS